ncbi:2OG-Fe dioxygenase family protein [Xenorhabdus littoralis]|uniref:2OG-Fe dioxygenase family protein n=1 Tax=Xenorhabdus littoralis TaxID=2582835 RepID=UPI0029E806FC|nr:2OG-Fe dioxygenase family protein [Xenorhabdus sp. psl]MDX7990807.1 hypothetical protein [Xenorhabdus sp. psl]
MLPIEVFSLEEADICTKNHIKNVAKHYKEYEYDLYLLRQDHINLLKKKGFISFFKHKDAVINYYSGSISLSEFMTSIEVTSDEITKEISSIKPYRKRLISEYNISRNGNIKKQNKHNFKQDMALKYDNDFDFRLIPRKFKQAPNELDTEDLKKILLFISNKIFDEEKSAESLNITTHYTIIECTGEKNIMERSNSPEGIHQDGMDYIVSALVMERVNIIGGESKIYIKNKDREIFKAQLQSGYGILQKDKGTDIWHEVTPIEVLEGNQYGYRSTMGFDIEVIN